MTPDFYKGVIHIPRCGYIFENSILKSLFVDKFEDKNYDFLHISRLKQDIQVEYLVCGHP